MKDYCKASVVLLLLLTVLLAGSEAMGQDNPVNNPSFQQSRNNRPSSWGTETWNGSAVFEYDQDVYRSGGASVKISSQGGADAAWYQVIRVEPFSRYRVRGYVRTEDVEVSDGRGVQLNLHASQPRSRALTGTNDWTEVDFEFSVGDSRSVRINLLFGGWGQATGTAWFDDIVVTQIGGGGEISASLNIADQSHPVNEMIFGQFIEHMGRCIYGGIWAEMLTDRKFLYRVGHRHSPWRAIGSADRIGMVAEDAFVGDHDPHIELRPDQATGIVHGELGLHQGKDYVGRIWLAGDGVDQVEVTLQWGNRDRDRQSVVIDNVTQEYQKFPLEFTSGARTHDAMLLITAAGNGTLRIGTLSLMPADNISGMRPDVIARLKELDAPIYRWPGGNFVSGYVWEDGIGDPDRRPPWPNPAWTGIEHNDFGTHEFLEFCRILGAEPHIVTNAGFGDEVSAARWVEYVNGAPETPMGQLRAEHGREEPWDVRYWGIGNEMWGDWQLGQMRIDHYIQKHNRFYRRMKEVDPDIVTFGSGDLGGGWSRDLLQGSGHRMEYISEHFYIFNPADDVLAHAQLVPQAVREKADAHRQMRAENTRLAQLSVPIAMTEWNYWYGPHLYGELGTRYYLRDGLGIAKGLHEMFRQADIIQHAYYAQTVNVIGAIKTTTLEAELETTGLVLKLYRQQFGSQPLEVHGDYWPLDVAAALNEDGSRLTIGIVNATERQMSLPLEKIGINIDTAGRQWVIAGDDPMLYNQPERPRRVDIVQSDLEFNGEIEVQPYSVTLCAFDVQ